MAVQVFKLLMLHDHELLEVKHKGPLCQAGRANSGSLEALQPWLGDAVLHDQLNAVMELCGDEIDELLT